MIQVGASRVIAVTLNPAIDRALEVPNFEVGQHARARLVTSVPAGKGINVARGVARLGSAAVAAGFVGRGEAAAYEESLKREGVRAALCPVDGLTRTNTTVLDPVRRTTTHLREEGFAVGADDLSGLRSMLTSILNEGRAGDGQGAMVFSGSLPPGMAPGDLVSLVRHCRDAGATVVVDTGGDALRAAVDSASVHTIKPNLAELGECLGESLTAELAPSRAAELLGKVETVLLTLGASGAFVVRQGCREGMLCRLDASRVANTVGCGDAFLAGWLHGLESSGSPSKALRWAVAAGAASALSTTTVGYTAAEVRELLQRCEIL